jgi:hypothetical protein
MKQGAERRRGGAGWWWWGAGRGRGRSAQGAGSPTPGRSTGSTGSPLSTHKLQLQFPRITLSIDLRYINTAASIGTKVLWYYCRAWLFGSRLGLPCKNSSLGNESVPALASCGMWTICMINCLRYTRYHADTGSLEPLMCRLQVRVPWGEWVNSATDCNLKTTGSK